MSDQQTSASVQVFASPQSWIEFDARAQCDQVAALDGMIHVAGMPDLHPGKGAPIHRNKASTAVRATHRPTGIVVVVDTERQFHLNRRLAVDRLPQRIEDADGAAEQAVVNARWRTHDELVRGGPVRVEHP